jgi:hypothetical protein
VIRLDPSENDRKGVAGQAKDRDPGRSAAKDFFFHDHSQKIEKEREKIDESDITEDNGIQHGFTTPPLFEASAKLPCQFV